jgi:hypothetical protein
LKSSREPELQPSFRVIEANQKRVVFRSRRLPGSLRCCGPVAVALAMVAGFALFSIMQGPEVTGVGGSSQCIPLGVGLIALGLTVINVIELLHREMIVFDGFKNIVTRQEVFVPGLVSITRWMVPFSRIQAVGFRQVRDCSQPVSIWGVFLLPFDGEAIALDRASDQDKMFTLANHLAHFLQVDMMQ